MLGTEPAVKLVNRVVGKNGKPVPQTYTFDGRPVTVSDPIIVPEGVARILIHQSMYTLDVSTNIPQYRLGCPEWDLPVTPIIEGSLLEKNELIDRSKMASGAKVKTVHINNPVMRNTPMGVDTRGGDRAFPGSFSSAP